MEALLRKRTPHTEWDNAFLPVCPCPCDLRVSVGSPWVRPAPGTGSAGTGFGIAACGSRGGEEQPQQFCAERKHTVWARLRERVSHHKPRFLQSHTLNEALSHPATPADSQAAGDKPGRGEHLPRFSYWKPTLAYCLLHPSLKATAPGTTTRSKFNVTNPLEGFCPSFYFFKGKFTSSPAPLLTVD